jgi:hypothetical protein
MRFCLFFSVESLATELTHKVPIVVLLRNRLNCLLNFTVSLQVIQHVSFCNECFGARLEGTLERLLLGMCFNVSLEVWLLRKVLVTVSVRAHIVRTLLMEFVVHLKLRPLWKFFPTPRKGAFEVVALHFQLWTPYLKLLLLISLEIFSSYWLHQFLKLYALVRVSFSWTIVN